jgi:hypothetical protein
MIGDKRETVFSVKLCAQLPALQGGDSGTRCSEVPESGKCNGGIFQLRLPLHTSVLMTDKSAAAQYFREVFGFQTSRDRKLPLQQQQQQHDRDRTMTGL